MAEQKRRILILGAGVMQGPAIRCAREMGLETAVIDGDPKAPLAAEADRFEPVDLKDLPKIEAFARKLQSEAAGLDGIMTAGTDFSASVAWAAEKLGLPGISYETALDASDKERMRARFRAAGLPSPAFTVFTAIPEENPAQLLPFPFPAVVKPVDNMGGRGCRRVDTPAELREAAASALKFSRSGRAIVEEYMEGPEFSVDAVIYKGEITICGLADRHIFFPPYFIEMGHTMPTSACPKDRDALIEVFIRGIRALGISDGAAKGDIKLTSRGPMIGEIAARLSGGYMSGWTYPYASGVNPARGAISAALGDKPDGLTPSRDWTSAERAFISIPGLVRSIEGEETARNIPGVKALFFRAEPGRRISFPENNVSKAGNVISAAPEREAAVQAAENAARAILIRLAAPDAETDAFLAGPLEPGTFPPPAYTVTDTIIKDLTQRHKDTKSLSYRAPFLSSLVPSCLRAGKKRENPSCLRVGEKIKLSPFPAFMEADLRDYMGRTPGETLEIVRRMTGLSLPFATPAKTPPGKTPPEGPPAEVPPAAETPPEEPVLGREFWTALIRGGYQGAVYYIDRLFGARGTGSS